MGKNRKEKNISLLLGSLAVGWGALFEKNERSRENTNCGWPGH